MKDREQQFADCVGAIYEAATGTVEWREVGQKLCRLLDAQSLFIDGGERSLDALMLDGGARALYNARYRHLNPYAARARTDYASDRALHLCTAVPGEALVADEVLVRSEYYNEFARPNELRYMLGGLLGMREPAPLALYRADARRPFDAREVRLLQMLLPHFQRALEIDERLALSRMKSATLDALPAAVAIVDADLRIRFLNEAARALVNEPHMPLTAVRSGPPGGEVRLAARSHRDHTALRRLAAAVATGGASGSIRAVRGAEACALVVAPVPRRLLGRDAQPGLVPGAALILLQPLRSSMAPPLAMLCDIWGLSLAEAEVAVALLGGRSAEQVALERKVALSTVRNQIRSILSKAEADNLRQLERLMSDLAAIALPDLA